MATEPGFALTEALVAGLAAAGEAGATVVRTSNRVRLVSARRDGGALEVRVSRRLDALGERALEPLVGFVLGRRGARKRLQRLFTELPPADPPRRRAVRPRTLGEAHDLARILAAEAEAHGLRRDVTITWGPRRARPGQRTIRLGSYNAKRAVIRVHRSLDDPRVPAWYLGFVVFHELLHHHFGIDEVDGRRRIHPPAFRARERQHPRFEDAEHFEEFVLPVLLGLG